jgi:BarA-like signal transduction histidine kinase
MNMAHYQDWVPAAEEMGKYITIELPWKMQVEAMKVFKS